jgi:hypothetical protein
MTFTYSLSVNPFGSTQPGASLVPLEGPSFPRALRDADEEVRALWVALAAAVTHPTAKARCQDIVFTLRLADNRAAAEQATRSYLESVGGILSTMEQSDGLLRARTLARSVGLSLLAEQVTSTMLDMVEDVLATQENPYVLVHLLDALTAPQPKKNTEPLDPKVDELLDRALLAAFNTPTTVQVATLVRRRATGDEARIRHASEVEVNAYLNDADKATDGLIIRAHLNDAAARARQLNLPDLEKRAVSRLQSAPPVEWKTVSTEFKIPNAFFRDLLRPFKQADTWTKALSLWFLTDSPSGDRSSNEATARKVQSQSGFIRLATTVIFGSNDLPKRVVSGDDDAFKRELVRVETMGIHLCGILLANALDLIKTRFGIPSHEDLKAAIAESGVHPALAEALSKGLLLYWVSEFEASAHLVVPKVEAAARALLLELNEPMYRTAVGDGTGQFPGLGVLLKPLTENGFDPDWERFLSTFLLGEGMNVRNLIAHGFMDKVGRETAALALRACALLVLITSDEAVERDSTAVKAALSNPHNASPRSRRQRMMSAWRAARNELRK